MWMRGVAVGACMWVASAGAQTVDPRLAQDIAKIKAIDNHAHPLRVVGEGETDDEYDALTFEETEPFPLPVRIRPDNPEWLGAWRALWGEKRPDTGEAHLKAVAATKQRIQRERGEGYPAW